MRFSSFPRGLPYDVLGQLLVAKQFWVFSGQALDQKMPTGARLESYWLHGGIQSPGRPRIQELHKATGAAQSSSPSLRFWGPLPSGWPGVKLELIPALLGVSLPGVLPVTGQVPKSLRWGSWSGARICLILRSQLCAKDDNFAYQRTL